MMTKDPEKRISLEEVLIHPWLTKRCPEVRRLRIGATGSGAFRAFACTNPLSPKIFDEVYRVTGGPK